MARGGRRGEAGLVEIRSGLVRRDAAGMTWRELAQRDRTRMDLAGLGRRGKARHDQTGTVLVRQARCARHDLAGLGRRDVIRQG